MAVAVVAAAAWRLRIAAKYMSSVMIEMVGVELQTLPLMAAEYPGGSGMLLVDLGLLAGVELRSSTHCGGGGGGETCWRAIVEGLLEIKARLDGLVVVPRDGVVDSNGGGHMQAPTPAVSLIALISNRGTSAYFFEQLLLNPLWAHEIFMGVYRHLWSVDRL